jgi:hypothetical protein
MTVWSLPLRYRAATNVARGQAGHTDESFDRAGTDLDDNSANAARLLEQARAGDQAASNEILGQKPARLGRMAGYSISTSCHD